MSRCRSGSSSHRFGKGAVIAGTVPEDAGAGAPEPLCAPAHMFELSATLAGSGRRSRLDGPLEACAFNGPCEGALLPGGGLLVADTGNNCLRFLARGTEVVTTMVGAPWLAPRSPVVTGDGYKVCGAGRQTDMSSHTHTYTHNHAFT